MAFHDSPASIFETCFMNMRFRRAVKKLRRSAMFSSTSTDFIFCPRIARMTRKKHSCVSRHSWARFLICRSRIRASRCKSLRNSGGVKCFLCAEQRRGLEMRTLLTCHSYGVRGRCSHRNAINISSLRDCACAHGAKSIALRAEGKAAIRFAPSSKHSAKSLHQHELALRAHSAKSIGLRAQCFPLH